MKYNLYFHGCEIRLFLYFHGYEIQLFNIYIIFNQYFPVVHHFVCYKRIYHGIEQSIRRITDLHHKAYLVMTIGDREGGIFFITF